MNTPYATLDASAYLNGLLETIFLQDSKNKRQVVMERDNEERQLHPAHNVLTHALYNQGTEHAPNWVVVFHYADDHEWHYSGARR